MLNYMERRVLDMQLMANRQKLESGQFTIPELVKEIDWKLSPRSLGRYCSQLGINYKIRITRTRPVRNRIMMQSNSNSRVSNGVCVLAREMESLLNRLGEPISPELKKLMYDVEFSQRVRQASRVNGHD